MKSGYALALILGGSATLFGLAFEPRKSLIWNRTGSAPQGLYRLSGDPFTQGRWVAVSSGSGPTRWASAQGFSGADWPLLKQIAALPGAEICRDDLDVFVDGERVASALAIDNLARAMPSWRGCVILREDEIFLLNTHPRSLDGRYFGATNLKDVDGVVVPLWTFPD